MPMLSRPRAPLLALYLSLAAAPALAAEDVPSGRYRCYQPPRYTVSAWFDLLPERSYSFQGDAPQRFSYDRERRELSWLGGELAGRKATYQPPGAGAAGERHAIILEAGEAGASTAVECFLVTH